MSLLLVAIFMYSTLTPIAGDYNVQLSTGVNQHSPQIHSLYDVQGWGESDFVGVDLLSHYPLNVSIHIFC